MENTLLNLIPSSYIPEVHLSQYDKGRELTFKLMDGNAEYSIPSGATITVKATKPSGLGFDVAGTFTGNVVTIVNTETMSNEAGRFRAELSIVSGNVLLGTSNFIFNVERSPHPDGTVDGDAETLLPELTLLVERIEASAQTVDEKAELFLNLSANATTLPAGSSATASYSNGILSLGIPKGRDGEVTNEALAETLEDYAKINGYYDELTSGSAEQLLSTQFVEDSTPYKFRTTGGSNDVGDREFDEIVGGSIVWNQLVKYDRIDVTYDGVSMTKIGNGSWKVSGTATANGNIMISSIPFVNGHKYLRTGISNGSATTYFFSVAGVAVLTNGSDIWSNSLSTSSFNLRLDYKSGATIDTTITPQIFDLTQMFGSSVADHIYSLEQAQSGKGVAFFKAMFPNDYYPYNSGELMSVTGLQSHDTVGFNQLVTQPTYAYQFTFDRTKATRVLKGEKYQYSFENVKNATNWRTVLNVWDLNGNKIPETTWATDQQNAFSTNPQGFYADSLSNPYYLETNNGTRKSFEFTFNQDCYVMFGIYFGNASATTEVENACLHLVWSGWRNGEYEEYRKHSYALDSTLTLRGIPKIVDGKFCYDGDEYPPSGKVNRRYGVVDLGSLNWTYYTSGTNPIFYVRPTNARVYNRGEEVHAINIKYAVSSVVNERAVFTESLADKSCSWMYGTNGSFTVRDSSYTSASDFKTAMSGIYLIYELANPTEEEATPYGEIQLCDDFGTEEYVTGNIVPVGHNTKYPANLRDKLQHLPNLADSDGAYLIRQTDKQMSLEVFRIPKAPTTNGTYILKATVSGGTPTYTWEVAE